MDEMWEALDRLLEEYTHKYGDKFLTDMEEGSEEWFARIMHSLLTTLSMLHKDGKYVP